MMFPAASWWTLLALSISITGSPVEVRNSRIILPMTSGLHFSNGTNPVQRDDVRLIDVTLDNAYVFSSVTIGVGGHLRTISYRLIVNTASAITWIGANKRYRPFSNTWFPISITYPYSEYFFAGTLCTDTVEITDGNAVDDMTIGGATETRGVAPFDGMLGMGPRSLSRGLIPTQPERTLETVTERLFMQGSISQPLVGLFFKPSMDSVNLDNGRLVFGDQDPGFNIGNIAYTPRTSRMPASDYWGIDQSIEYGDTEILPLTSGIVDSGMTFIFIASDAYEVYKRVTGAYPDPRTGMLSISLRQYNALLPLEFHISGQTYKLSPNGQIWPRQLNYMIQGIEDGIYLVIKSLDKPTGHGIDFCLGYAFLQRFYSVFDAFSASPRVGFATTPYTNAFTN
ncbi:aspartic peptidase domain-containing protein [Suillus spraguei]|nr:aspartic peptidase domain-containing protein [Suillus spraguei]